MIPTEEKEDQNSQPPLFGSWPKAYWFVVLFFVAEVVLFYFFTKLYS